MVARSRPRISLFCEDQGHELFVRAMVKKVSTAHAVDPVIQVVNARGGLGRALTEFSLWQRNILGLSSHGAPDLLVLIIDANCSGWSASRQQVEASVDTSVIPRFVVGCPDPHIERWYMADPQSFARVVGVTPPPDPGKCERHLYKRMLRRAVDQAEIPLLASTADLAPDLVQDMDLFRAGKSQPSLKHFVDELTKGIRALARS